MTNAKRVVARKSRSTTKRSGARSTTEQGRYTGLWYSLGLFALFVLMAGVLVAWAYRSGKEVEQSKQMGQPLTTQTLRLAPEEIPTLSVPDTVVLRLPKGTVIGITVKERE